MFRNSHLARGPRTLELGNGAPGMRPNFNKVVSFQRLSEVPFWKSGPESGPNQNNLRLLDSIDGE